MTRSDIFNSTKEKKVKKEKPLSFITIHSEEDYYWVKRNMTKCEIWKCHYWPPRDDEVFNNRYIIVTVEEVPNRAFNLLLKSPIKEFTVQLGDAVEYD